MHQHASQRDERLARAALCNDIGIARQLPSLAHAHDCQGLGWIWNAHHPGKQWGRSLIGTIEGRVRREDPVSDLVRVSFEVLVNRI